ncbi:MAG TPA: hypothetical protein VF941_01425 [Clostridia bacterium]
MIKVTKPNYEHGEIVDDCTYNIRSRTRLSNILASKSTIELESLKYDEIANQEGLSSISTHEFVFGGATKEDMVWLYDAKFVKDGGRKYYDKILLLPKNGICPMCGKRTVSTLDHYLPKTQYPTYAVTSFNLVAACSDCNKAKRDKVITSREEEPIHPYYDDFDDEVWIKANLIEEFPIGFSFTVFKPESWPDVKFKRAENHFNIFNLNVLYSLHASEVFAPYKIQLRRLYVRRGDIAIKEDLEDRIESHKEIRRNSWEAAMYTALLNSKWFFETYIPAQII